MPMRNAVLSGLLIAAGTLAACAPRPYAYYHVPPPPPPPVYGVVGVAPGPGFVWVDGFWDLRGGRWFWVRGHWVRPPRPRAAWVPGYWSREREAWRFRGGYWR